MTEFKRSLGLLDAVMLVSGSMIGSGIFIVTASMGRELGSAGWIMVAWLVSGLLTIMAALSYGELSGMMPKAGGQYVYLQRAYGKKMAFLYGWTVFTVIQTGVIAAVAVAFAKFTAVFFPALSSENIVFQGLGISVNASQMVAIGSILLLTWLNTRGVQDGKMLQTAFTLAKLAALAGLIVLGIYKGMGSGLLAQNFTDMFKAAKTSFSGMATSTIPLSGLALISALGLAMVGSLFSSDAWNNVTFIAGEIKDPKRNIPLSLFFGTLIVTTLYVLANLAYFSVLSISEIQTAAQDRVGTAAAEKIFGDAAVLLMAGLIMISTFGCNNGIIMAGARLFYAMAADGLFFKKAALLNKHSVPGYALWVQCAWACVLCLSGRYGDLLEYTTFASLLFYMVTIGGLFILRKKEPDTERPYRAFGYPVVPALYLLLAGAFCLNLLFASPVFTVTGLGIVLLGLPVYYVAKI